MLETARGNALLIKKDIFRNLMWYTLPESSKQYPLSIATVRNIKSMNAKGIRPDTLETEEVVGSKPKEVEPEFVDVVGQISLRSLDKNSKKKKHQRGRDQKDQRPPRGPRDQKAPAPPQSKISKTNNPRNTPPPQQGNSGRPNFRPDRNKEK